MRSTETGIGADDTADDKDAIEGREGDLAAPLLLLQQRPWPWKDRILTPSLPSSDIPPQPFQHCARPGQEACPDRPLAAAEEQKGNGDRRGLQRASYVPRAEDCRASDNPCLWRDVGERREDEEAAAEAALREWSPL